MGAKGGHGRARWHLLEGSASVELEHLVLEPLVGLDHGCSPVHLSPAHWSADAAASRAHGALCACQPARGRPVSAAPRSCAAALESPRASPLPLRRSRAARSRLPGKQRVDPHREPAPRAPPAGWHTPGCSCRGTFCRQRTGVGFFFSKKYPRTGSKRSPTNIAFGECRRSQASMLTGHRRGGR